MNSYLNALRSYAKFSGRMSRAAYWQFVLVYAAIAIVALIFDNVLGTANDKGGLLIGIVAVVHLIPNLASLARRLHDSDRSALWMLLLLTGVGGLLMLIFALLSGTPGPNRFGVQPTAAPVDNAEPSPAGAASVNVANRSASQPAVQVDVVAELERLAALRSNGSLSDSEYEVMKSRLLTRSA